jgi:hypothetical protein
MLQVDAYARACDVRRKLKQTAATHGLARYFFSNSLPDYEVARAGDPFLSTLPPMNPDLVGLLKSRERYDS